MEMTIDEAKMQLSMQKFYVLGKDYEAVQVAIDIMHKYRKIEQIVKEWEFDHESMVDSMEKISEVIKNG